MTDSFNLGPDNYEVFCDAEIVWMGAAIVTDDSVTYIPYATARGQVGYVVRSNDGDRQELIYLNASTGTDDGEPNVFLYQGESGDPANDEPSRYYLVAEDWKVGSRDTQTYTICHDRISPTADEMTERELRDYLAEMVETNDWEPVDLDVREDGIYADLGSGAELVAIAPPSEGKLPLTEGSACPNCGAKLLQKSTDGQPLVMCDECAREFDTNSGKEVVRVVRDRGSGLIAFDCADGSRAWYPLSASVKVRGDSHDQH